MSMKSSTHHAKFRCSTLAAAAAGDLAFRLSNTVHSSTVDIITCSTGVFLGVALFQLCQWRQHRVLRKCHHTCGHLQLTGALSHCRHQLIWCEAELCHNSASTRKKKQKKTALLIFLHDLLLKWLHDEVNIIQCFLMPASESLSALSRRSTVKITMWTYMSDCVFTCVLRVCVCVCRLAQAVCRCVCSDIRSWIRQACPALCSALCAVFPFKSGRLAHVGSLGFSCRQLS